MSELKPNSLVTHKGKGVHYYYGEAGNVSGYGVLAESTGINLVRLDELEMLSEERALRLVTAAAKKEGPPSFWKTMAGVLKR